MAVYTMIDEAELAAIAAQFGCGRLIRAQGIAEGVENSNYLLTTQEPDGAEKKHILTLFEKRMKPEELPFFMALMQHLAGQGVAVPQPYRLADGEMILNLRGRPVVMVSFLQGTSVKQPNITQTAALGQAMAEMHLAAADAPLQRDNDLSLSGWAALIEKIGIKAAQIAPALDEQLRAEIDYLEQHWPGNALPQGIIHADLFPNNVFFEGDQLSGIIDFYFACSDALAYDLAICANCWCFDRQGHFLPDHFAAMLVGYQQMRPLSDAELAALPMLMRGAALRFLLTRAHDALLLPKAAVGEPLDPEEYLHKWRFHLGKAQLADYGVAR